MQGHKHYRAATAAVDDTVATDGDVDDLEEESPAAENETAASADGADAPKVNEGPLFLHQEYAIIRILIPYL